jgi:competence protein ComEC
MSDSPPDPTAPPKPPPEPAWKEFARAPLVPVAVAVGVGLVVDRYLPVPFDGSFAVAILALVAWVVSRYRGANAPVWLWLAAGAFAAAHHHAHRHSFAPDDIAHFATDQALPVKVRGTLAEEPARFRPPKPDPLLTIPKLETTATVLAVREIFTPDGWMPASGRARLTVEGRLDSVHLGDVVEVVGRLSKPHGPANPGELDYRSHLLDDRITATLRVARSAAGVTRLEEGWRGTLFGWLAVVRGWGTRALQQALPHDEAGLAAALLLGDGTAMSREEWDVFVRTGVVHVLAISGQHLVILAGFVWLVLRVFGVRRRRGAWVVMVVMIGYALLTGGRPSAVRAAVMVCVLCGGIVLRRPVIPANAFAFAWLIVVAFNPTDPFTAGCQLSFLAVFTLLWGASNWLAPGPVDPLDQLIDESRSSGERFVRWLWRVTRVAFAVSFILGVALAPLVLYWQNLVTPLGILLGPPLIVLTAVALVAGFLLLLASPFGLELPFALVTKWMLGACESLVLLAEKIPGGWVYASAPPLWWLVGFHVLLAAVVLLDATWRRRSAVALAVWSLFGVALGLHRTPADEARITFLSVGHGCCCVVETPDGRVLVYDAGTISGPDTVRRVVAPFLWHRGVRRIDELFLSHADLDHFNGVPELLKRFAVGRVTLTPSFADKTSPGVSVALAAIEKHGVPWRTVTAGDKLSAGAVTLDVLHPPPTGPPGNENTRSMVLLLRHAGHAVLLTGDLEGVGQEMVRASPIPPVDVLLAPHHGAANANLREMAAWARPRLVVSSQAARPTDHLTATYGAIVWDTPTAGAVTLRSHATGLTAEAFRSGELRVVRRGK